MSQVVLCLLKEKTTCCSAGIKLEMLMAPRVLQRIMLDEVTHA